LSLTAVTNLKKHESADTYHHGPIEVYMSVIPHAYSISVATEVADYYS